jgi:hypothetical protein
MDPELCEIFSNNMSLHSKKHNHKSGFAVLLSVLVLASIGTIITASLLTLGTNSTQTSASLQSSEQARGVANACAELALQRLVTSSSFVGTGNLTLGQGSCTYAVTQANATTGVINATGTVGTVVRKVQIRIALPTLIIASWQEVGDF